MSGHEQPAVQADPAVAAAMAAVVAVPAGWGLRLDPGLQRFAGGTQLLGGSPLRLLKLKPAGAAAVDGLAGGDPVGRSKGRSILARRLFDAGMAHPVPAAAAFGAEEVTVIIPVCDDADGLAATLASLAMSASGGCLGVIVVDDGSAVPVNGVLAGDPYLPESMANTPVGMAEVGCGAGAAVEVTVLRRAQPGGPGIARQHGLVRVATPFVTFLDAGVVLPPGWLADLAAYFADPLVVAVAPRIRSMGLGTLLERYEQTQSPLDLGAAEARVAPRSRVAYVPTAMLVARRQAVVAAGGFDPGLRYGEDVDLVWRLVGAGGTVRYAPQVVVCHPARASWMSWWRQRVGYGSAAAPLTQRHPGDAPPVQVSAWSAAAWGAVAAGHPVLGLAVAAGSGAMLPRKLEGMEAPNRRALELAGRGHLLAGRWLARSLLRPYWPLALGACLVSRRARRTVLAAAVVPALLDWRALAPPLDPLRFTALRLFDDVAYATGVWWGCVRTRSLAALRPDLSSWPGRRLGGSAGTRETADGGAQAPSSQLGARSSR